MLVGGSGSLEGGLGEGRARRKEPVIVVKKSGMAPECKNSFTLCQKCDILFLTIESDKYDRIY